MSAERPDTSVIASLSDLMRAEAERVEEEERIRTKQAADAYRARQAAKDAEIAAEKARLAAEQERQKRIAVEHAEAEARKAAIVEAAVVKAKAEAEHAALLQRIELEQSFAAKQFEQTHQADVRTIKNLKQLLVGALIVMGGVFGGVYAGHFAPEKARLQAELDLSRSQLASIEQNRDQLSKQLAAAPTRESVENLEKQVESLRSQLAAAQANTEPTNKPGKVALPQKTEKKVEKKDCKPGDPMCE